MTVALQELIDDASKIVFMTGAGVSTASGICDYRSRNGIYNNQILPPEYLLSTDVLMENPKAMYQFILENMFFPDAKPNVIHEKMAKLTQQKGAKIITQNVDGLHLKANSKASNVIEFHGNIFDIYSVNDNKKVPYQEYEKSMYTSDEKLLRPNITLYGEMPFEVQKAMDWVNEADLIVIVGTSFVVYPFAGLLEYKNKDAKVISINMEKINAPLFVKQEIGNAVPIFEALKV